MAKGAVGGPVLVTEMMPDAAFRSYVRARRGHIEAALRRSVQALAAELPPALGAAAEHGVMSGGKRLRPLLLIAAYEELGGRADEALYDLSAAVEMIHAYSLMHDDLPCMDDAPLRRGRPTPHTVHGVSATTLAGAALIPWAGAWACRAAARTGRSPGEARAIAARLLEAAGAGGMIGGQALDLLGEGCALGERDLAVLHRLKTGALLSASLEAGAMAAGANGNRLAAMGSFGRDIGLAFQLMDDVLDATSTSEDLGKQPSDVVLEKSTYVALLGAEGARERARQLVTAGVQTLAESGLAAPWLRRLGRFVIERRR